MEKPECTQSVDNKNACKLLAQSANECCWGGTSHARKCEVLIVAFCD